MKAQEYDHLETRFHGTVNSPGRELHFFSEGHNQVRNAQRFACYVLTSMMPEEGLDEAFGSLRDIWEFHSEDPEYTPLPPAAPPLPEQVGEMLAPATRPALVIEE